MSDNSPQNKLAPIIPSNEMIVFPGTPEELERLDLKKVKTLFDLQEQQKNNELNRKIRLEESIHKRNMEREEVEAKQLKTKSELWMGKIQGLFKIAVSASALAIGTMLVMRGQAEVGYFLIGGGMTSVTTDAARIMREARRR
jgi:hypothetical protein